MRYSYAQTVETGEIILWALGESGWLEIRPARSYKAIFQDMIQAIELLYFVADVHSEPRKRGGGPSVDSVFQEVWFRWFYWEMFNADGLAVCGGQPLSLQ